MDIGMVDRPLMSTQLACSNLDVHPSSALGACLDVGLFNVPFSGTSRIDKQVWDADCDGTPAA
jgi:hypothetical protein